MSANVNTCATLVNIQLAMDTIWSDNAKQKDYIAKVDAINAIKENQTVTIEDVQNPMKDRTVTVYWPEFCSPTTVAKTSECTTNGTKPGTSCQDYQLSMGREVEFAVSEKTYRTVATNFEDAVAVSMLANLKALDEWIAVQAVLKMEAGKGVNQYTGGKGSVSGFTTSINPAYWNHSLFPYLQLVAEKNKFSAPYLVSGVNLYEAYILSKANAANADGKGASNLFDMMKIYFDLFNVDSTLSPDAATFMLNRNSLAFHNKVYYPNSAAGSQWTADGNVGAKYSIESKNIPGVKYDVIYKVTCADNDTLHNWKIQFTGDIFRNPVGCNPNNTNILKFVCA